MSKNRPLTDVYIEYQESLAPGEVGKKTWNDFFDYAEVPMENRSDFAVAAMLNSLVESGHITQEVSDDSNDT